MRNKKGTLVHTKLDGSDWCLSKWSNAIFGEAGEAANVIKKYERGDYSLEEILEHLGDELADVVIYLDLTANSVGIDLGEAVRRKFNKTSVKTKNLIMIADDGSTVDTSE
jgi:NTP pyrophosphatase (non-canonical NTP hydrolase)